MNGSQHGIRLPDGRLFRGGTWDEVEARWSGDFMNQRIDSDNWRAEIEHRAKVWSGIEIDTNGSAYDFLMECERAGLLVTISAINGSNDFDGEPFEPASRLVYLDQIRARNEARLAEQAARAAERAVK